MINQPISLLAYIAAHDPAPSSDYDSASLASELAGCERPNPCTVMQGFMWENAWRAKASVLRAKALVAALNATESKAAADTSPLFKAWCEALAAKRAETRAQVAEDRLLDARKVEIRLRRYIRKLQAAGDDLGRDEDSKWWSKVRNEQP